MRRLVVALGALSSAIGVSAAAVGACVLRRPSDLTTWLIAVGLIVAGLLLQRAGRRLRQPTFDEIRRSDHRAPVLLLRRFKRDQTIVRNVRGPRGWLVETGLYGILPWYTTWEELLVKQLQAVGPVLAVGRPGEVLQPAGASRLYASDEEWQGRVRAIAGEAALVTLIVDDSAALRWELAEVSRLCGPRRMFLVLPPRKRRGRTWYASWNELRAVFPELPQVTEDTVAVHFQPEGQPRLVRAAVDNPDLQLYAIDAAIARYLSAPGEPAAPVRASLDVPRRFKRGATSAYLGIGAVLGGLFFLFASFGTRERRAGCDVLERQLAVPAGPATVVEVSRGWVDRFVFDDPVLTELTTALNKQVTKVREELERVQEAGRASSPELEKAVEGLRPPLTAVTRYCGDPG
jgi:hypothetical protein